jgi:phosphoribosylformylglycinamidine cyclo-ligase
MKYHEFVDYTKLDPVKKAAIDKFGPGIGSIERLGMRIIPETLGESAIAIEIKNMDYYLAFNVEGLGTKNLIADSMYRDSRGGKLSYFENIGKDTVAMSTNDLSSIGADPFVYGDILSTHNSDWFEGRGDKAQALLEGFKRASDEIGMPIPCGETPSLKGIITPGTLDMAGASVGIIQPKKNLTIGQKLQAGDIIFGLDASGVHSNGISLIRATAEKLPEGYFTSLPSGKMVGEEILIPTHLYSRVLMDMLKETEIHYMQPITGHGWKKIMRNRKPFTYRIHFIPQPTEIFTFLQEKAGLNDEEAYYTWNMGIGYVLIAPKESKESLFGVGKKHGIGMHELGVVEEGKKSVILEPKKVTYWPD